MRGSRPTTYESTPTRVRMPNGEVVRILTGEQEHHISADIAYAVWHYWQATGDDEFFLEAGAEILLETARFWASRGQQGPDGCYHIAGVIGPDEYHEGVDDNIYTNVMAQWNLECATEAVRLLQLRWPQRGGELLARLQVSPGEWEQWPTVAQKMYGGLDPATWLIEQFRGYFDLEPIDLEDYEPRTAPMDVLLGRSARSDAGDQAGRRGPAPGPALGTLPACGAGSQLPLLRAPHGTRQFAEPRHPRAGGRPSRRCRLGRAVFPSGCGDRPRE